MQVTSLFSLGCLIITVAACASNDGYRSCSDGPLLARAKTASNILFPAWYGEDWGRAAFATVLVGNVPREVCANDAREARRFAEESDARIGQPPTRLVRERETAKYFELAREENGGLWRVHRCAYLDRSAFDYRDRSANALLGTLAVRPITFEVAREAARYVWSLGPEGAVISEPTALEGGLYGQDFETATIVSGDLPAEVTVRNVRITVNATTGDIVRSDGRVVATEREHCVR